MTDTALFIGWGNTHPGREHQARKLFDETVAVFAELKQHGEIDRFEPVLLAPHGGELYGFFLVYGVPEKLLAMQMREEIIRLRHEGTACFTKLSIMPVTVGAAVERELTMYDKVVTELERVPALV